MSVNQQALQKLLMEMDSQLQKTQAELQICQVQINRANNSSRITTLTSQEINSNDDDTPIWKGVGKIFVRSDKNEYLEELNSTKKDLDDTLKSLNVKKSYLETTLEKTIDNMNQIVGPRQ